MRACGFSRKTQQMFVEPRSRHDATVTRMIRDGILTPLPSGGGAGKDIELTPAVKAFSTRHGIPQGGAVGGLAALWVWGFLDTAYGIEVVVKRGPRPKAPAAWHAPWTLVTDSRAWRDAVTLAGVKVLTPHDAVAHALARASPDAALKAGFAVLRHGNTAPLVSRSVDRLSQLPQNQRAYALWHALREAANGGPMSVPASVEALSHVDAYRL